jgi:hypothetical protein
MTASRSRARHHESKQKVESLELPPTVAVGIINEIVCPSYNFYVARGWESKSVEAQQDEASAGTSPKKPRLTREDAARARQKENIRLALQSIVQQIARSHDARHLAMLDKARADLQEKMEALNGEVQ